MQSLTLPLNLTTARRLGPTAGDLFFDAFGGLANASTRNGISPEMFEVLRTLREYDADASNATWAFLLNANPGHTVAVHTLDGQPLPDAEARLNALAARIGKIGGGGADTLINTLHLAFWTYGGAGIEVQPTPDLRDVRDFHAFGPADIEWRWVRPVDGTGKPGEPELTLFPARTWMGDDPQPCNPLQTFYLPLLPDLNDPYGRPPLLAAVSALVGLVAVLREVQDILKVQGVGRQDVTLDSTKVLRILMPNYQPDMMQSEASSAAITTILEEVRAQIEGTINQLGPTDTHVHYDFMTISTTPPGTLGIDLAAFIAEMIRRVRVGLKTPGFLAGGTEGTQTQATTQWSSYVKGLRTVGNLSKRLLEAGYDLTLRLWGIPGKSTVTFNTIRETDRALDAMTEGTEIANEQKKYELGATDHTELSQAIAGHDPAGPAPPTAADTFGVSKLVANAQAAQASAFPSGPLDLSGSTPAPSNAPPPGSDAGISAEEGAALDLLGSHAVARTTGTRVTAPGDSPHLVDLGQDAAEVLGMDVVEAVRKTLREQGALDLLDLLEAAPGGESENTDAS